MLILPLVSGQFTRSDRLYHSNNVQTHVNMLDDSLTTGDLIDMFYENYLQSCCTLYYRCKWLCSQQWCQSSFSVHLISSLGYHMILRVYTEDMKQNIINTWTDRYMNIDKVTLHSIQCILYFQLELMPSTCAENQEHYTYTLLHSIHY